jgi:hypothetical protein
MRHMSWHHIHSLFMVFLLYTEYIKLFLANVYINSLAFSTKYGIEVLLSICSESQYLLVTYAWLLALFPLVTSALSDTVSNPVSISQFKRKTRLHYKIVARREIYLRGESTLLSHTFCANPVESIEWICRKATEMTLANPEKTTEVLLVLLPIYVQGVYKERSHILGATEGNVSLALEYLLAVEKT